MFNMNTYLKQTPLPTPSLGFLTRNFSDGTNEMDDNSSRKPIFDTFGLQNDLDIEHDDQRPIKLRSHRKKVRIFLFFSIFILILSRQMFRTSSSSDFDSNSINSLQFASSTIISQSNSRIPLTSILKKPASQIITNPYFSKEFSPSKIPMKISLLGKNDFENNPFTVSFNIPSTSGKASQSIFRSEKLVHRKK